MRNKNTRRRWGKKKREAELLLGLDETDLTTCGS